MNIDTGEIIRLKPGETPPEGFTPIPIELEEEAEKVLRGEDSVLNDLNEYGKLKVWRKEQQELRKKALVENRILANRKQRRKVETQQKQIKKLTIQPTKKKFKPKKSK